MNFKTTFRIAIPRSNGYDGFDHKTETIKIDCAYSDKYVERRIRDYIKNEMQIEDFVLLWFTTPPSY